MTGTPFIGDAIGHEWAKQQTEISYHSCGLQFLTGANKQLTPRDLLRRELEATIQGFVRDTTRNVLNFFVKLELVRMTIPRDDCPEDEDAFASYANYMISFGAGQAMMSRYTNINERRMVIRYFDDALVYLTRVVEMCDRSERAARSFWEDRERDMDPVHQKIRTIRFYLLLSMGPPVGRHLSCETRAHSNDYLSLYSTTSRESIEFGECARVKFLMFMENACRRYGDMLRAREERDRSRASTSTSLPSPGGTMDYRQLLAAERTRRCMRRIAELFARHGVGPEAHRRCDDLETVSQVMAELLFYQRSNARTDIDAELANSWSCICVFCSKAFSNT